MYVREHCVFVNMCVILTSCVSVCQCFSIHFTMRLITHIALPLLTLLILFTLRTPPHTHTLPHARADAVLPVEDQDENRFVVQILPSKNVRLGRFALESLLKTASDAIRRAVAEFWDSHAPLPVSLDSLIMPAADLVGPSPDASAETTLRHPERTDPQRPNSPRFQQRLHGPDPEEALGGLASLVVDDAPTRRIPLADKDPAKLESLYSLLTQPISPHTF